MGASAVTGHLFESVPLEPVFEWIVTQGWPTELITWTMLVLSGVPSLIVAVVTGLVIGKVLGRYGVWTVAMGAVGYIGYPVIQAVVTLASLDLEEQFELWEMMRNALMVAAVMTALDGLEAFVSGYLVLPGHLVDSDR